MKAIMLCPMLAAVCTTALAQDWSDDQQELLDIQAACNDGWVESHRQSDFEIFRSACPHASGVRAWYTGSPDRVIYWDDDTFWSGAQDSGAQYDWEYLEPIDVWIDGDSAAVYFPVAWIIETPEGEFIRNPSRRLSNFERRDGQWVFTAMSIAGFDENPESLLVNAALQGNTAAVTFLLDQGHNINERAPNGYTALHAAAYEGHLDIVRLLVERGAIVNDQQNTEAIAPLHAAAELNRLDVVAYLLSSGVDVNPIQAGGWSPVMRATFKGFPEMVRLLRSFGGECIDVAGEDYLNYCMNAGS